MRRIIENKLATLEKKLNSEPLENDSVIIYFVDEGIPEELLNDSVPHIFIPDNGRDPEFEPIQREKLKLEIERAGKRRKAKCLY
ncbi:hypothetical protein [Methanosarcina sp. UBA5]|uniref:hypothetical protein n=1 Tax=Methanosarcina sp. UBA5 TaxID=1915593 RepID=UPI0025F190D1|nr:hypothetical protein [Methanosarcina sp. UBA5]